MTWLKEKIKQVIGKLMPAPMQISSIVLRQSVVDDIIEFARSSYPKEFVAVLQGEIRKGTVVVTGLLYQPFHAAQNTAIMQVNLPMISNSVGSVHSHPSPSNRPSRQDLQFFGKRGIVNLIIAAPYTPATIACFDYEGNSREFTIMP